MRLFRKRTRTGEFKMEFTPMIDVVFLLLIFFMCTLKFKTLENKLATYLPTNKGPESTYEDLKPEEKIRLKLSMSGGRCLCFVNGRATGTVPGSLRTVYDRLRQIRRASPKSPVEIDPDPTVPHKHVVSVLDECIRAKATEINFVAALPALKLKRG